MTVLGQKPAVPLFGPWKLNEMAALGSPQELEDAWNVDLEDGLIKRRRGRRILMERPRVRLSGVYHGIATVTDYTEAAGDGLLGATSMPALAIGGAYYFGLPFPFIRLEFSVGSATGAGAATTLAYEYWNGTAWTALSTVVNRTAAGSFTSTTSQLWFAVNGYIEWALPTTWRPGGPDTAFAMNRSLYWVRIRNTGASATTYYLSEAVAALQSTTVDIRTEGNGLFEFIRRGGDRRLVMAMDAPGRWGVSTFQGLPQTARVFEVDWSRRYLVPLDLPEEARETTIGARWQFAVQNGWLLATNGYGPVLRYDGKTCTTLEAALGTDAQDQNPGARAYLPSVPRGKYISAFRSRIAIAGVEGEPDTVYLSEYDTAINIIPNNAPVGGANVWPAEYNWDATSVAGDPITGLCTVNDRLAVLKKHSVFVYDDGGIRSVTTRYGCFAPGSLATTAEGCFFLSRRGVCFFDGGQVKVISGPVERTLRDYVNWMFAGQVAVGELYQKRNEYRLWLPVNGQPKNSICLIYNYKTGIWTKHCGHGTPWMTFSTQANPATLAGNALLNVAATATVQEMLGDEALITLDFDGQLWLEDTGDTDNGLYYWSWVAFPKVGWTDESLETWRDVRIESTFDGEPFNVYVLPETMEWPGRVADGASADAVATPLVQTQPIYSTPPAFPVTWPVGNVDSAASERFGMSACSIGTSKSNIQIGLLAKALYPHRWAIRGIELAADPRARRR